MKVTKLRALLNGELLFPMEDQPGVVRAVQALQSGERHVVGATVEKLLLYDRMVVPTVDMVAVPYLVYLLGLPTVLGLLEAGDLRFVRYRGAIMYLGGGAGLEMVEIRSPINPPPGEMPSRQPSDEAERKLWAAQDAASVETDEALSTVLQLMKVNEVVPGAAASKLSKLVLDATVNLEARDFRPAIEQSYRDVLNHKHLHVLFSLQSSNLKHLLDFPDTQTRWLHERHWNDDIDVILHLAQFNIEWYLANRMQCEDRSAGPSAFSFAHLAQDRSYNRTELQRLLALNRVPDLSVLADDDDALHAVLSLRNTRDGEEFRVWFHGAVASDPEGVCAAYVDLLNKRQRTDKWPVKVLRFLMTTGLGIVPGGMIGVAASAADSLLGDRLIDGPRPGAKIFLRKLQGSTGRLKHLADEPS